MPHDRAACLPGLVRMLEIAARGKQMSPRSGMSGLTRIAAFVATMVLVLQSALAVAAPPVQRDIFGNVICADGSGYFMPSGDSGARHLPDSCMLSCNMALQVMAGPPPATPVPAIAQIGEAMAFPSPAPVYPRERRTPANPRAPPSVA